MEKLDTIDLYSGDCLEILPMLGENSIDSCVTDPPYHLTSIVKRFGAENAAPAQYGKDGAYKRASAGFMGKTWDGGDIASQKATWELIYRVIKPGGHLIAMGGTRTYHRMVCAIEDAGFDIRDTIGWVYGSGFPKSHNQGNGWGTALKPAMELIVLARKTLSEKTVAANVLKWGTGALNIDGCRVDGRERTEYGLAKSNRTKQSVYGKPSTLADFDSNIGRWPANLIHDGSDEVISAFPETTSAKRSGYANVRDAKVYRKYANSPTNPNNTHGDSGSVARFFYQAKADASDRLGSKHPTVKPLDLMRYLVRLTTPKGGTMLDPFAGTGSTGEAAYLEGMKAMLIEREEEYLKDIRFRIQCFNMTKKERKHTASIRNKLTRNEVSKKEDD